jgi:nudix-type nucleoside diphosphatase (YffH/AdpP family)
MTDAILTRTILHRGWMSLVGLRMVLGGVEVDRSVLDHPSGAAILAFDPVRRVAIVIQQTRQAVLYLEKPFLLEAVGGVQDEGEDSMETARREMLEETGVPVRDITFVAKVWMTPSSTTERVDLFLGEYSRDGLVTSKGGLLHEQEDITIWELPIGDLWTRIEAGEMMDGKLFMLLQALRVRRPELFQTGVAISATST